MPMFSLIQNLPGFAVGIVMIGEVTKKDFEEVLIPAVKAVSKEWKGINLLLVLETKLTNFTEGAWRKDIMTNLRYYWKWNKIGLVTKDTIIEKTFSAFDLLIPGEVKIFSSDELNAAIVWISEP